MRYKAHLTIDFEFEVPGDDPSDAVDQANRATAPAAAEVITQAAKRVAAAISDVYEEPRVTFTGEPVGQAETSR